MERPFRFVVLGAGGIAGKFCDAVYRVEGCEVAGVASKSMARAEAFCKRNGIQTARDDYARLLDEARPDCAYIATTCDSHAALTRLCLERDIPVLCEKAMFVSAGEAQRCVELAKARGVFCMEALWSLFLPAIRRCREWIEAGEIGRPVSADFEIGFAAPRDPLNRYFNPALGGGAANDLTVYALHIMPWVIGQSVGNFAARATRADTGVDETDAIVMRLSRGALATVRTTLAARVSEQMTIRGTRGLIHVPQPHMARRATLMEPDGTARQTFEYQEDNGFVHEIREVMRRVRAGETESGVVPLVATLSAARQLDAIRASMDA